MKPKTIQSILAAALLAPGALFAQTSATTIPVGYETLAINSGFNFISVRLHNSSLASGTLESFTAGSPNKVKDDQVDLGALITGGSTYILEINDGSGIIQEVVSATGTELNIAADLSALTYPVSYTLRKASTVAGVFGTDFTNLKLDFGSGSTGGADQVWLYNGSGFDKYYYDKFGDGDNEIAGWYNVDTGGAAINAANLNLIYADSFILVSAAGKDVTIEGEVKKTSTEMNLVNGFNFVSSVAPVGATLQSAFGDTFGDVQAKGLKIGFGSTGGADQLWFFNGSGYTKTYYDKFGDGDNEIAGWYNVDTGVAVPSSTDLPVGYILSAAGGGNNVNSGVPSYYSTL
jgi:hypothetical protein